MKVLHFFKTYWPDTFGGIERTIHAIATGTQRYGIETEVLSLSKSPHENALTFAGHRAHKAKLDLEIASTGLSRSIFRTFADLSKDADVVHYHFPWPMADVVHFATRHGKPTVLTYHSDIVKQKLLLRVYSPLMRKFLRSVDQIVATSPNYVRSSDVLQEFRQKTAIIPLGLDESGYPHADPIKQQEWRRRFPEPFFLFVGVLRYYKGLHVLLDAAKRITVPIVIIGDGPMEASLKAQAQHAQLDHVHFIGACPDEDKMALIDLCAGLVFPSWLRSEAFGLSLVEASMRSKPMISCEIGTGTSYVNLHGVTGLVVPPDDPTALADALVALHRDSSMARNMGRAARIRYDDLFTADKMARDYAAIYARLG